MVEIFFYSLFTVLPVITKNINPISSQTTSHSYIKLIQIKQDFFIVKQKINMVSNPKSILKMVLLSKLMRKNPLLHIQEVKVIPAKTTDYPKYYKNSPASLHKVVPGKSIREWIHNFRSACPKFFLSLRFQQRKKKNYQGLTRALINMMTKHKNIPAIIAFNTLFGDYDCHRKNVFYDDTMDQFFLIDMDSSFKYNLCELAIKNVKKMIKNNVCLSKKEIRALIEYALVLENLMTEYPINTIVKCARKIIRQFKTTDETERRILEKEVNNIAQFLLESYQSAHRLIKLIHCFVSRST